MYWALSVDLIRSETSYGVFLTILWKNFINTYTTNGSFIWANSECNLLLNNAITIEYGYQMAISHCTIQIKLTENIFFTSSIS